MVVLFRVEYGMQWATKRKEAVDKTPTSYRNISKIFVSEAARPPPVGKEDTGIHYNMMNSIFHILYKNQYS